MHVEFVSSVFDDLLARGWLRTDHRLVAVAAGGNERDLFVRLGFTDALLTNLDAGEAHDHLAPFEWQRRSADHLGLPDRSVDWAVVIDGLHHCRSPHAALAEMYRVARVGVLAIEARDSLLTRLGVRLRLVSEYETEAVRDHGGGSGGLDNGPVPNHVYRWTESEFRKTIRSADPTGPHVFRFLYGLNLPYEVAGWAGWGGRDAAMRLTGPALRALTRIFPRLRNTIAMVALRPAQRWPWLDEGADGLTFVDP